MKIAPRQALKKAWKALEIPAPDQPEVIRRLKSMERNIVLLAKAVCIWIVYNSFYASPWMNTTSDPLGVAFDTSQYFFWFYVGVNVLFTVAILAMDHLPLTLMQWGVFTISLMDSLFIAMLMLMTGGTDSILFWVFVALIVRNAISMPPGLSQVVLNLAVVTCYILSFAGGLTLAENGDDELQKILGLSPEDPIFEPFLLRVTLLLLLAICCYAFQVLLERQQREIEEAREFTVREVQLRSAGRLAAEFAHQIKNPLAIINTTLFSLRRALKENRNDVEAQIEIIQEEITRSDRIINQVTDYAKLTEGRLEKLDLVEELDRALEQVFPAAASRNVKIERDFGRNLTPLVMQRPHLSEILVNILQNAREATKESGTVTLTAVARVDRSVELTISDTGDGIPPDKIERVFEAYYTTKEKGSGLGLSIVKHNVELYGGRVRAESGTGKGARFIIEFPAKTLVNLSRQKN